jgi:tetraacyldisaccharide 4'-kinase
VDAAAVWYGNGVVATASRSLLAPFELAYRGVVATRNRLYDAGWLASMPTAIPALSVGNLSVGGTGKTPIAAHIARALRDAGARPALLLRGYGGDESRVHALLNPDVPVFANADRVSATATTRASGCDVAVLDDAFQHRRAARLADVVLISADQWTARWHCLPRGPYREPLHALHRASLVLVTRKAASLARAEEVRESLASLASTDVGIASLQLDALHDALGVTGGRRTLDDLRGRHILAVAGIGAPAALALQLEVEGARVTLATYPDHHRFDAEDAEALARRGESMDLVVCTLKDAVKLAPLWPRAAPTLWYVSQRVEVERGVTSLNAVLRRVLDARDPQTSTHIG